MNFDIYTCPITNRRYDPYKLVRHLDWYAKGKLNELIDKQDDLTAQGQLAQIALRSFSLPALAPDGSGHTEAEGLAMLEAFSEYVEGKGSGGRGWRRFTSPSSPRSPTPTPCSPCGS